MAQLCWYFCPNFCDRVLAASFHVPSQSVCGVPAAVAKALDLGPRCQGPAFRTGQQRGLQYLRHYLHPHSGLTITYPCFVPLMASFTARPPGHASPCRPRPVRRSVPADATSQSSLTQRAARSRALSVSRKPPPPPGPPPPDAFFPSGSGTNPTGPHALAAPNPVAGPLPSSANGGPDRGDVSGGAVPRSMGRAEEVPLLPGGADSAERQQEDGEADAAGGGSPTSTVVRHGLSRRSMVRPSVRPGPPPGSPPRSRSPSPPPTSESY